MSKERELLKKALDFMLDVGANLNPLFKEINDNLLAQPEQKPLTPRQGLAEYKRGYDKGWKACKYCYTNEELREGVVGYLYKQMDCHGEWATIFKVDKPYITWHDIKDIVPVYTTQPKREPLGEEESYHEAKRLYEAEDGLLYEDGFVDGLKFAEKMHGIGGGE